MTARLPSRPPAVAAAILRRVLPLHLRDAVLGDLDEAYASDTRRSARAAKRRYWRQVVAAIPLAVVVRLRDALRTPRVEKEEFVLTVRQAARYAFVLFLPSAFALACVILFVEGLARRGSLIGVGTGLNLPLFIGGPVTMAFGYAVMLLITERLVHRDGFNEQWPHVLSAIGCIVLLGVVSIFTQGAGLPFILGAYVVAGAITAVIPVSRGLWVARER